MVDFEKRNLSFRDPYFDNDFEFNNNKVSVERYKSSKNDDFRYSINCRMNRSNQSDYNTNYRCRSRSRENYRINNYYEDKPISNSFVNTRVHNCSERRYLLDYPPPPEFERSRSYNYLDSYEYDMGFVTYEDYYESDIYTEHNGLVDDFTNKENIESKMTLMVDNSRNKNGRINSLLGDGPEHLRIYPPKYEHFEEDIYYTEENLTNDVDDIERNNKYEKLDIPVSTSSEQHLSKSKCFENNVSVFDYNHQNQINAINLEKSILYKTENNFGKYDENVSRNISSNCIDDSKIDQTKIVSNVLQNEPVKKINDSFNFKWILIPLDAPLRVSISADNINVAKCSKKDPRIEHVI